MAFLFGCENVHLEYPVKTIFESLSLGLNDGARIGIVGKNGDGKSSLLGLFDSTVEPDSGRVLVSRGVRFAHLGQADALDEGRSVRWNVVGDMPEYVWASDPKVRSVLEGLLHDMDVEDPVSSLSGGQRRRVDLARVLVADADVLLLDEPTNHLDMGTIAWLAAFLQRRFSRKQGALLLVTHDRWFLDEVCTSMWEVHDGVVEPFEGGYSAYVQQRVERDRQIAQAEAKRRNLMRRELAWLSRGARARSTKPKFHVEAARELIAQEPPIRDSVELKRTAVSRQGKQCVTVKDVSFSYGDKRVIDNVYWPIGPGDRFALLGANGAGKSTLLDLVRGVLEPQEGHVKIGKTVKFAYLSQRLDELAEHGDDRVRDVLKRYNSRYEVDGKVVSPAQLLEQLGFEKEHLSTPVSALSGGQRRRLQLMLILLDAPNVLILDEPSNDLDTDMMVAMENVLDTWPGTLVLVSHDRYLTERVTDQQFALIDGRLRHVPRGVDEYLELLEEAGSGAFSDTATERLRKRGPGAGHGQAASGQARAADGASAAQASREALVGGVGEASGGEQGAPSPPAPKLSASQQNDMRKKVASLERRMATLDKKIEQAKADQVAADQSDYQALEACQAQIVQLQDDKSVLEEEWIELSLQLEG